MKKYLIRFIVISIIAALIFIVGTILNNMYGELPDWYIAVFICILGVLPLWAALEGFYHKKCFNRRMNEPGNQIIEGYISGFQRGKRCKYAIYEYSYNGEAKHLTSDIPRNTMNFPMGVKTKVLYNTQTGEAWSFADIKIRTKRAKKMLLVSVLILAYGAFCVLKIFI